LRENLLCLFIKKKKSQNKKKKFSLPFFSYLKGKRATTLFPQKKKENFGKRRKRKLK